MSELVVIGYKSKFAAEEVRLQLLKMQREYLIDLADAVVAVKERDGQSLVRRDSSSRSLS